MTALDGLYRHQGTTLTWNTEGLVLLRPGAPALRVAWRHVRGARQVDGDEGPVEILVDHRAGIAPRALRAVRVAVNSTQDARRLVTTIDWHAAAPVTECVDVRRG